MCSIKNLYPPSSDGQAFDKMSSVASNTDDLDFDFKTENKRWEIKVSVHVEFREEFHLVCGLT